MQANEFPRPDPQDWRERAECRNHPDVDWAPEIRNRGDAEKALRIAAPICAACPVRNECEDAGRQTPHGDHGIYAGQLSRRLRAGQRPPADLGIRHGTTTGYRQHYRREVPMCEPCRVAFRTYEQELRRTRPARRRDRHATKDTQHDHAT
jgi:hypothetical protein